MSTSSVLFTEDAIRPHRKLVGAEPLPGYKLLSPLGRGNFGEVWKCEAPGGLHKAIKFVASESEDGHGGERFEMELSAFEQIKAIRHPFLLTIERVEQVGSELVMVMELADQQLLDRFRECRNCGLPGIPREELLAYFTDAAEALDMISAKFKLQHLDVKPTNLFLVSGHVKVGDYGLVAHLEGRDAGNRALTPRYVAPEVLHGAPSSSSDQYSLALVYHELLTGEFPYPGRTPHQLMLQHVSARPNLAGLPPADQPVIAKALTKTPDKRYPSCLAFVQAFTVATATAIPNVAMNIRRAHADRPGTAMNFPDIADGVGDAYPDTASVGESNQATQPETERVDRPDEPPEAFGWHEGTRNSKNISGDLTASESSNMFLVLPKDRPDPQLVSPTMRSSNPPELTQLLRNAIKAVRAGERERAHTLFGTITERDPKNEAAWLWYANTAENAGDALIGLRAALYLNPNNPTVLAVFPVAVFRAGIAAAQSNDKRTAADLLAEATSLDSTNEAAWLWRAAVTDDPAQAIRFLEHVLHRNPANAQAKAGVTKLRARLASAWRCPLCECTPARNITAVNNCPECGAAVTLKRPEVFDGPLAGLNRPLIESAARRLKVAWAAASTPDTAYALGLAYLNLGCVEDGVRTLQVAIQGAGTSPAPAWRADVARFLQHRQVNVTSSAPADVPDVTTVVGPRVMVVDDSPTVRMLVTTLLTCAGYAVTVAENAEQASRLVHEVGPPQLFILDVNMPGIDGFGLCKFFRAAPETAGIPVVFLTGKTGLFSKIHGRWVGAADYLTKPFESDKLLATVGRLAPISKNQTK